MDDSPLPALVAALRDDPFYRRISIDAGPDERARDRVLQAYFACSLDEAGRTGRCRLAPDPAEGASAWLLPRDAALDAREQSAKRAALEGILGPLGRTAYWDIVGAMGSLTAPWVADTDWYLSIIGISPSAQGRGLGEQLLRPTLDEADAAGVACYLETFTPRNIRFYARLGFAPVAELIEPVTGSAYTVMRRGAT